MDDILDAKKILDQAFSIELIDDFDDGQEEKMVISNKDLNSLGEFLASSAQISEKLRVLMDAHNSIKFRTPQALPTSMDNPNAQDIFLTIFAEPLESELFYPIFEILYVLFIKNNYANIEHLLESGLVERCAERTTEANLEETSLILHCMACIATRCKNYHTGVLEIFTPDLLNYLIEKDSSDLCDVAWFVYKATQRFNDETIAPSFADFCINQINRMYDEDENDFIDISELNNFLFSLYFCSKYMDNFSIKCYEIAPTLNKILFSGFGDLLYVGLLLISAMFSNPSSDFIQILSEHPIIEYKQIIRLLRMPSSNLKGRTVWVPILAAHIVKSLLSCKKYNRKVASVDCVFDNLFSDNLSKPLLEASDLSEAVPSIIDMVSNGNVERCVAALKLLKALIKSSEVVEPTKELDESIGMLLESDDEPILFHAAETMLEFYVMLQGRGQSELIGESILNTEEFGEILEKAEGYSDRVAEVISKIKALFET